MSKLGQGLEGISIPPNMCIPMIVNTSQKMISRAWQGKGVITIIFVDMLTAWETLGRNEGRLLTIAEQEKNAAGL